MGTDVMAVVVPRSVSVQVHFADVDLLREWPKSARDSQSEKRRKVDKKVETAFETAIFFGVFVWFPGRVELQKKKKNPGKQGSKINAPPTDRNSFIIFILFVIKFFFVVCYYLFFIFYFFFLPFCLPLPFRARTRCQITKKQPQSQRTKE